MWGADVGYNDHRNGIFDNPVSVISRCLCDTNVVGASRRGARPGRRFLYSKADAQHLASKTTHDEQFFYCLVTCPLRNKPGLFKQTEYSESLKNNHLLYTFLLHFFCKDGMIFYINCHNFTDEGAVDTHAADNCFTIGIFF